MLGFLFLFFCNVLNADDPPAVAELVPTLAVASALPATAFGKKRVALGVEHPRLCDWSLAEILPRRADGRAFIGRAGVAPVRPALGLTVHGRG